MRTHLLSRIFLLSALTFNSLLFGEIRERFVIGWTKVNFLPSEKVKEIEYTKPTWLHEHFYPYNAFYVQLYPLKTIGFQLEIGGRRWESYYEQTISKRKYSFNERKVFCASTNLIYKFQFLKDIKLFPYLLIGVGLEGNPEYWENPFRFGAGIKYCLSPSEGKKGKKPKGFLNLNIGAFYWSTSLEKLKGIYYGLEVGF